MTAATGILHRRRGRTGLPPNALKRLTASLQTQWKRYRKTLRRCQERFSEGAVHDSRVEARRLLSRVELLGAFISAGRIAKVQTCLKRHLDSFDDLRDTQVQMRAVAGMLRKFPAACPFLEYLQRQEKKYTKQSRKCIKRIRTGRLARLVRCCREEAQAQRKKREPEAANALLLRSVDHSFARTAQLKEQINPRNLKTIHRTRVAFKKFRYMVETLAEDFPVADDRLLRQMHDYQTMMGDIQDMQVLLTGVDSYLDRKGIDAKWAREFRSSLLRRRQKLVHAFLGASNQLFEFWLPPRYKGPYPAVQPATLSPSSVRRQTAPASKTSLQ